MLSVILLNVVLVKVVAAYFFRKSKALETKCPLTHLAWQHIPATWRLDNQHNVFQQNDIPHSDTQY